MAVASDITISQDGGQGNIRLHPYLVALVRWCVSCVWSTATVLVHRLMTAPLPQAASKPLSKPRVAGTDHLHPEPKVECVVLHTPETHNIDVVFVHGLYGSLGNTWRQGDWRPKYKIEPNKVPIINPTICNCQNEKNCKETYNANDYSNITDDNIEKQLLNLNILENKNVFITEQFYNNRIEDVEINNYEIEANFVSGLFKKDNCEEYTKNEVDTNCECKFNEIDCEAGCGCLCDDCYSSCWPKDWIQVDYPDARIISVNYTSDPYLWRPLWVKESKRLRLHERAEQMTEQLLAMGVGQRPIIWVGHSKGGLFIKQIYCEAYEAYLKTKESTKNENDIETNSDFENNNSEINKIYKKTNCGIVNNNFTENISDYIVTGMEINNFKETNRKLEEYETEHFVTQHIENINFNDTNMRIRENDFVDIITETFISDDENYTITKDNKIIDNIEMGNDEIDDNNVEFGKEYDSGFFVTENMIFHDKNRIFVNENVIDGRIGNSEGNSYDENEKIEDIDVEDDNFNDKTEVLSNENDIYSFIITENEIIEDNNENLRNVNEVSEDIDMENINLDVNNKVVVNKSEIDHIFAEHENFGDNYESFLNITEIIEDFQIENMNFDDNNKEVMDKSEIEYIITENENFKDNNEIAGHINNESNSIAVKNLKKLIHNEINELVFEKIDERELTKEDQIIEQTHNKNVIFDDVNDKHVNDNIGDINIEISDNLNDIKDNNDLMDMDCDDSESSSNNEEDAKVTAVMRSKLWTKSAGFMFYSVPHRGSPLADIKTPITTRSIELLEISKDCSLVLSLQERWLAATSPRQPAVRSLVETQRTLMSVLWLRIVSECSADAGIGALYGVSVDHREICKPSSRRCLLYTELMKLMRSSLNKCQCQ